MSTLFPQRQKPFLARLSVFLIRNVIPLAVFAFCVYTFAMLVLPMVHPDVWLIITMLCTALAVLDRTKRRMP